MRPYWPRLIVFLGALLALPAISLRTAFGQNEAVHWHSNLESAKSVAKATNRLVLVHFWTPSCGPCMALNQNVFNQPGVAGALEAQFVPVKLNADENSATATWFGITRVPTDVIITPDGQIVSKLVSPPTPAAYVAEVTAAAGKQTAKSGQAYAKAAAAAPVQPQLNSAYANLQVSPNAPLAIATPQQQQPVAISPGAASVRIAQNSPPVAGGQATGASSSPAAVPAYPQPIAPQIVANPAATMNPQPNPAFNKPIGAGPAIAGATVAGTTFGAPGVPNNQVANPHVVATTSSPPAQQQPVSPLISQAQTTPIGYEPLRSGSSAGAGVPPAAPGGPALASATPDPRQLPPGAPPLGFDGYCPVSMRNSWKWVAGDARWGVVHRGHTYWFAGPEEQKQFWTDPDRYTPALSGIDPVLAFDHQQQVPGKREHALDYDGLFYMFASEATLQQFTGNPQRYSAGVRQAMGIPRGRLVR